MGKTKCLQQSSNLFNNLFFAKHVTDVLLLCLLVTVSLLNLFCDDDALCGRSECILMLSDALFSVT